MKSFEILLNNRFTASTQTIDSNLELENNYYAYVNSNGGGIVNFSNVRGYLNDPRNQQITTDFFAYLTGNTTPPQALNIIQSDQKLADVFNDYYQRIVISATQISSTAVIQANLTGANQNPFTNFYHPWSGYAPSKQLTGITQDIYGSVFNSSSSYVWEDYTNEQSYYVPVYLERGTNQMARYKHDLCDVLINKNTAGFFPNYSGITNAFFGTANIPNIASNLDDAVLASLSSSTSFLSATTGDTRIHTILDCFVDLNLELNEQTGAPDPLNKVSFQFPSYSINEGNTLQVRLQLDSPSVLGIEEATVNMIPLNATLNQDYFSELNYPYTFSFSAGEQYKFLKFTAATDYFLENPELFNLEIANIINLDTGTTLNSTVTIQDTTVLRTATIQVAPPAAIFSFFGSRIVSISEGEYVDILVKLDGPAFGVESVTLSMVNSVSTPSGTITIPNPATPGTDFVVSATSMVFTFAPGETQKTYRFSAKTDIVIENFEGRLFELQSPQFCLLNPAQNYLTVNIQDTTGGYKYVHLNLGRIYSEFGNSQQNTLMRQINPQPTMFSSYSNMYANHYAHNLIELGTTIKWRDYVGSAPVNTDTYYPGTVVLKMTNLGEVQSIVNGLYVNTGQTISIPLSGSDFVITATTNTIKNTSTNLFEFAKYKMELVNYYSGSTIPLISSSYNQPVQFTMRSTGNTISTNKTIDLGTWNLSGMTTFASNTTNQYRLKSKYKNVNTGRPNVGSYSMPFYICPPVASFSYSISYSEFYAVNIENISILGLIFLNYNAFADYNNNTMSTYDTFEFVTGITNPTTFYSCNQTVSEYNGLDYISLPFKVEP